MVEPRRYNRKSKRGKDLGPSKINYRTNHVVKVPPARIELEPVPPPPPAALPPAAAEDRKYDRERYIDAVFSHFIENLGELDELKDALAFSESPKAHDFLADLVNPANVQHTVTYLARRDGLNAASLADIWRSYNLSKGILTMVGAAPAVSADIAADSRSSRLACSRCDGFGVLKDSPETDADGEIVPGTATICPQCAGKGYTRKSGDNDARKLMLESIGWIGRRGQDVNVNVNVNSHSIESVLDDLERQEARTIDIESQPD